MVGARRSPRQERNDSEVEHTMRSLLESVREEAKLSEWNKEQLESIECGIKRAVEEK